MKTSCLSIEYFSTHQEREAAFAARVNGMLPQRLAGPESFWKDFNRLVQRPGKIRLPVTHIPADPRQCLAFSSARQVLWAAGLTCTGPETATARTIGRAADMFGLEPVLDQPIRSLSGGEAAKTALAKAWMALPGKRPLVMASPSGWLSASNAGLLKKLVDHYTARQVPVSILAMEGEDDSGPMEPATAGKIPKSSLFLNLECRRLEISLGRAVNTLAGANVFGRVKDTCCHLASPCLITGDNGQGKSLLAKAICGALPFRGRLKTASRNRSGPGRLIFQDVVAQAMMRDPSQILKSVNSARQTEAASLCRRLQQTWRALASRSGSAPPARADRLLRIKLALAAVRLAARPAVLILDEPDWGLSRRAAEAFVLAVIERAHALDVPVILISHKSWWNSLSRSRIRVVKSPSSGGQDCRFTIGLKMEGC